MSSPYGLPPDRRNLHEIGHERVGNTQRTTVLDLLGRALEEGYLDLGEYEARLVRVTEGKTVAELHSQVADLPPQFRWDPFGPAPKAKGEQQKESASAMAIASIVLGAAGIPISLCFGAGGIAGVVAVFLAGKALRQGDSRTKAIIGLTLGIVGIVLSIGIVLILLFAPDETTTRTS